MQQSKNRLVIGMPEIFCGQTRQAVFLQPPVDLVEQVRPAQQHPQAVGFETMSRGNGAFFLPGDHYLAFTWRFLARSRLGLAPGARSLGRHFQ
jgi:hypothetical protein